jgi:hypothetical protein
VNQPTRNWGIVTDRRRGFSVCRALAQSHSKHCLAVHTANPSFKEPTAKRSATAFLKYRIARLTRGKLPLLSFGYLPTDFQSRLEDEQTSTAPNPLYLDRLLEPTLHHLYSLRPQTLSFSLCDSPVGLLAALLDVVHTRVPSSSPLSSRSRSPFLSPVELEMQESNHGPSALRHERIHSGSTERPHQSPRQNELEARNYTWTPTEILNWTMMQWLPGKLMTNMPREVFGNMYQVPNRHSDGYVKPTSTPQPLAGTTTVQCL